MAVSKYSHDILCWGGPQLFQTPVTNIGASQSLATVQSAYTFMQLPYGVIFDIVLHFQAMNVGGGTVIVDVYNTTAAGSSANSFLSANWQFTNNAASPVTYSARGLGASTGGAALKTPEIGLINDYAWPAFVQTYSFGMQTPFSVRCQTPAGASITGLCVSINVFASDLPNLKY
jgi:hypothetical protein